MTQTQNHLPWVPRAQSGQGRSSQALTRAPNPAACVHPGLTSRPASPPGTPPGSQAPLPPFFPLQAPMRGSWLVTPTVLGGQEGTGSPTVLTASQHVGDPGPARSCPCSDPPPPHLCHRPARLGQDGPQTGPGSGSAQHPLPARKVTPETLFGHRSSHWPWAGALRRDSGTERRRDGDRSYLSNQSPSQTMPHRDTATIPGHGAPTRLQVGRLQPPAAPCPPWLSPHSTWLCSENSSGVILAAKNRRSRLGEPSPPPPARLFRAVPTGPPSPAPLARQEPRVTLPRAANCSQKRSWDMVAAGSRESGGSSCLMTTGGSARRPSALSPPGRICMLV